MTNDFITFALKTYTDHIKETFGVQAEQVIKIHRTYKKTRQNIYKKLLPDVYFSVYENLTRLGEFIIHNDLGSGRLQCCEPYFYDGEYWNLMGSICYNVYNGTGNELLVSESGRLLEKFYLNQSPHILYENILDFVNHFKCTNEFFWDGDNFLKTQTQHYRSISTFW